MKKSFVVVIVMLLCLAMAVSLVGCGLLGIGGSSGSNGSTGKDGKSAYEIAVENGYDGTLEDWLKSLAGKSAYDFAVENGFEGTFDDWMDSLKGEKGERGTIWFAGSADPNVTSPDNDAREGDFYFRTFSDFSDIRGYEIYWLHGGQWVKLADMTSPATGTEPLYTIRDRSDFESFCNSVSDDNTYEGKTIVLASDLDLGGETWSPIGKAIKVEKQTIVTAFCGTFDGNGKTISGLTIDDQDNAYSGFFAAVDGATIKNLTIEDAEISTTGKSGVLAGLVMGSTTIENVCVSGSVESADAAGGLVGYIRNLDSSHSSTVVFKDCINDASVKSQSKTAGIAAHVEFIDTLVLEGCVNNGDITTVQTESTGKEDADAAGILGYVMQANSVTLRNCSNNGAITSTMLQAGGKLNVGGIVSTAHANSPHNTISTLENCTNSGKIVVRNLSDETNNVNAKVGGIVGSTSTVVTLKGAQSLGDIEVYADNKTDKCSPSHDKYLLAVGALMGNMDGGTLNVTGETKVDCSLLASCTDAPEHIKLGAVVGTSNIVKINEDATGNLQIDVAMNWVYEENYGLIGSTPKELVVKNTALIVLSDMGFDVGASWDNTGKVSNLYSISSAAGFKTFCESVNNGKDYKGETVMVGKDIDLGDLGEDWTPIGTDDNPFKGTFDGRGYTISNLTVDDSSLDNVALFGRTTDGAIIKNFTLKNVNLTGNHYVASVVGNAYTTNRIDGITVEGAVLNGTHWVAGIVGSIYGNVYNCHVSGLELVCSVEDLGTGYDNGDKVGGIVGQLQDSGKYIVDNCSVDNASLTAYRDVGGIVGCGTGSDKTYSNNRISNLHIIVDRTVFYGDKDICAEFIVGRHGNNDTRTDNTVDEETCSISYVGFDYVVDYQGNWHVYTADGLVAFQQYFDKLPNNGNALGITVMLEDDIDLSEMDWQPIGLANTKPFKDVFDGQGHTIYDMSVNKSNDYVGLFTRITDDTAEVKNVVFENVTIVGGSYVGTVAGRVGASGNPKLSAITVKGNIQISGGSYVGAVVGHIGAIATNLTVDAKDGSLVKGRFDVGGIAGTARAGGGVAKYTHLSTNIDLFAEVYGNVGGLVGRDQGGNRYEDCKVYCNLIVDSVATNADYNMVNACFGDVSENGTTVDGFTFEGLIMGGSFTGFCESYEYDVQFTNSKAVVTRNGQVITFTADESGNVTDDTK